MLQGKQLILATREYAVENRLASWRHFLVTLAALVATYAVALSDLAWGLRAGAGVLAGLLLVRMFILYHDFQHCGIFYRSLIMKGFFTLFGLFILAPASIWRRSHNYHHANNSKLYTSSIGSYPIVTSDQFLKLSRPEQRQYLFIRHPVTILSGYVFTFLWGMCARSLLNNPGKHWDSALALLLHVALGATTVWLFGWSGLIIAFLVPAFISSAVGSYLFYAQHNFPEAKFTDKAGWSFADAAMRSSSYMRGSRVMHWFTANIGYHHIHHANPRIPFYRLPEVLREIPAFQVVGTTSLRPRDIAACLRLKVWNPDLDRMLTLSELQALQLGVQPA